MKFRLRATETVFQSVVGLHALHLSSVEFTRTMMAYAPWLRKRTIFSVERTIGTMRTLFCAAFANRAAMPLRSSPSKTRVSFEL